MKMSHILLEKAFKYNIPKQRKALFRDYKYNNIKGYWVNVKTGNALMLEDGRIKPRTKKEDIETGEDNKGE
jgi:uncharacterized protein YjaZ